MHPSSKQTKIERLQSELEEALDRQAATADILNVICNSPGRAEPVFDAIVNAGLRLFPQATVSIALQVGHELHVAAIAGPDPQGVEAWRNRFPARLQPDTIHGHVIFRGEMVDIPDVAAQQDQFPGGAGNFLASGYRAVTMMPIAHGDKTVGALAVLRMETGRLAKEQFALLKTFAAQANIAIENVRQFREVQTRFERERASRAILQVISQSRDNEQPVFDAIVKHSQMLCDASMAVLVLGRAGDPHQRLVAHSGLPDHIVKIYEDGQFSMDPGDSIAPRAILEKRVLNISDMAELPEYKAGDPRFVAIVDDFGTRSNLVVPLILDGEGIGALFLPRRNVRPYDADETAMVESFAAKAVIAIENVRQLRALAERTEEVQKLNASLEQRVRDQVGEIERMGRLKRFLPAAVADTVVSSGSEKMLSSHRSLLGVLFCDIRGFTAFCETAEPEETIEVLQTYHEEMGKLINAHGAGVDHRMGDGIMVLFNDPLPCEDPAGDAVRLAVAMRARMTGLCKTWKRMGYRLGFGVGVSLGYATVGLVGFEGRFDYTASGTAINLASRLCDEALDGEILLSPKASIAVEDHFEVESRGELSLKGLREPFEVFRLAGSVSS